MTIEKDLLPILNFQVVAVSRKTGEPRFATIAAPSQVDADDFVADLAPNWLVIRDNTDLIEEKNLDN